MLRRLLSQFLSGVRSTSVATSPLPPVAERPYRGDFVGTAVIDYRPDPDGTPDPGEIVWTWVPFEEDHGQGKDRPVLIVAQRRTALLCLMLTSKDHDGRAGADDYVDIGAGPWDPRRRPSEVRIDRVLQIDPEAVRREGAILERRRFELVAEALRSRGWR
ncbi:hypothetical protein SCMU_21510 [Sinomonas cyclohexanicum]|uniref:PemK-like, MazF-like toxin of type II toxin-antitoxin system n=1 Tax=Sinomonas cyclohexanicum TaxID=322009 RepID=A0ABN6FI28_SINCY|nr:type II toxin-antitoxin system PemK/MazF family toxin [Corynebacterium cyclohexanicum]BCT76309.1 hypothetical protein SCMU_21510 [Corynebacterium cyclohexanicum]